MRVGLFNLSTREHGITDIPCAQNKHEQSRQIVEATRLFLENGGEITKLSVLHRATNVSGLTEKEHKKRISTASNGGKSNAESRRTRSH